jgi:hypothetical protein
VKELDYINKKLIQDYSIANIPEYRDNPTILDGSVAIHYRCSDSLGHRHYGVYPFRIYKKLLQETSGKNKIVKVTIFSDAKKDGTEFGEICWNLRGCSLTVPVHTVHTCTCACWFQTRFQVPCLVVVS